MALPLFRQRRARSGNSLNCDDFAKDMIKEQHPGGGDSEMIAFAVDQPERFKLGHTVMLEEAIASDAAAQCNAAKINACVKAKPHQQRLTGLFLR